MSGLSPESDKTLMILLQGKDNRAKHRSNLRDIDVPKSVAYRAVR